ncbi:LytTR family two component transcriptional regulator [Tenacibaculum adriaticum]|uniref:LytTR family two component transcriptional regulator n=1 Tax=Tenacibaculum adriaticum TaxID=413713 RepID=A0A5S5DXF3_9FLAO|nr:LytTR family DNA-binding domain-containing protein [Tenacibaculum adriaticum]TYP99736.1 LytTR family two component transcriptional regulator [Tenacibaculum adriaticum]
MKIQCLIVDDEPLAINVLKKHLESFDNFNVSHTCNNPIEAFNILSKNQIQLIFIDINMPKLNGIEFIKSLSNPPLIIITTAYREFAVEGFELDVTDYLVKPIALKRIMKSLNKVSKLLNSKNGSQEVNQEQVINNNYFFIKVDKKMIKIFYDDILYIKSLKDYVSIKTIYDDYITHYNLLAITKLLPNNQFIRIHRSFTIAINKVMAIDGNCIHIGDKRLPIGRNFVKEVKDKILREI